MNPLARLKSVLYLLPFIACLIIAGCEKDSEKILNTAELAGTWQLIESDVDLTDGEPVRVRNGFKITFNRDSTFTSEKYGDCNTGTFSVLNEEDLLLEYDCPENEGPGGYGSQIEKFRLKDGYLILVPTYKLCIEGCYDKFEKISD